MNLGLGWGSMRKAFLGDWCRRGEGESSDAGLTPTEGGGTKDWVGTVSSFSARGRFSQVDGESQSQGHLLASRISPEWGCLSAHTVLPGKKVWPGCESDGSRGATSGTTSQLLSPKQGT